MVDEEGGAPAAADARDGHAEPRAASAEDPVRCYLREIGRVPLLTASEEVELARRIERGQRRLLGALAGIPMARRALGTLGAKLRRGAIDAEAILALADETDDPAAQRAAAVATARALRRLGRGGGGGRQGRPDAEAALAPIPLKAAVVEDLLARVRREHARGIELLGEPRRSPAAGRERRALEARVGLPLERHRAAMAEIDAADREVREAKRAMVEANLRLVVAVARRYLRARVPLLDLVQEGNLGLMKAVDRFEYRRGFKLSTYATWWIRQAITRAIADRSRTIRMPVHLSDALGRIVRAQRALEQELRREPSHEEIARRVEVPVKKVRLILESSRAPLSLDTVVGEDSELGEFLPDVTTPPPDEPVLREDLSRQVERALATLHPREGQILRLRFGLDGGGSASLEEIGERFGLTRERIRQIEGKALRKLRHPLRGRHLRAFVER